jgi:hypothetical protein
MVDSQKRGEKLSWPELVEEDEMFWSNAKRVLEGVER